MKIGTFALKNLKVVATLNADPTRYPVDCHLRAVCFGQTVQMLEGQAEGSMVGFKIDFRQEPTLTLRVRLQSHSQHLDSPGS